MYLEQKTSITCRHSFRAPAHGEMMPSTHEQVQAVKCQLSMKIHERPLGF